MNYSKELSKNREQDSFIVESPDELGKLLESLHKENQIEGIGFDVFGTLLTSLYTRTEQSILLSERIAKYYKSDTKRQMTDAQALIIYNSCREGIRQNRSEISQPAIPTKQQECPEVSVLRAVGDLLKVSDLDDFITHIQDAWLEFDLEHTLPIQGMLDLVAKSATLFGRGHVGIYSNNSCTKYHLSSLLQQNGYLDLNMIYPENVFISSEFGMTEYGVGLRKPNIHAFNSFAKQLRLKPADIGFVGDGGNDLLFATQSGGIGVRLSLNQNSIN